MRRPVLFAAGTLATIAALLGGFWLVQQSRADTDELEKALLAEIARVESDPRNRPVAGEPIEGSFGEHLFPHLAALARAHDALQAMTADEQSALREVVDGTRPLSELPATVTPIEEAARPAVLGALKATLAASARSPEGMRLLSDPDHPLQDDGMSGLATAARLTALQVRRLVDAGRAGEAVDPCVSGFALGRDAGYEQGLLGAMVGTAITRVLFAPCADAFDAAPLEDKRRAAAALPVVLDAVRPLSEVLKEERVYGDLLAFGPILRSEAGAEAARRVDPKGQFRQPPPRLVEFFGLERTYLGEAWRDGNALRRGAEAAVDLPREQRDARLQELHARAEASDNVLVQLGFYDPARASDKHRTGRAQIAVLAVAAAADAFAAVEGRWPADQQELVAARLLPSPLLDARTDAPVALAADGGELRVGADDAAAGEGEDPRSLRVQARVRRDGGAAR